MYDQELKCQILDLLKIKSVKEVSEQFDISASTLYRWQRAKEDSKLIKKLIVEKRYEDARKFAKDYPNDGIIQSQLMTIYMRTRKDEKIVKDEEEITAFYNGVIQTKNLEFPKEIFEIRSKISRGVVSVCDLDILENFKEQIGLEKYLLIKLAVYERLGLLNMGGNLLKKDTVLDIKLKKQLMGYFERKNRFYDLEKWDSLIGWFSELEVFEKESPKEYLVDSEKISKDLSTKKYPVTSNVQNSNNDFLKVKNNVVDISKKPKKVIKVTSSKIGEQKKKKVIKNKNKDKAKTLNDVLNQNYKAMILSLKIKYYKEMYDKSKRKSAMYKYDRLEEILSSEPSIKNFDLLLLMLIGDGDNCFDIEQSIPKQYHGEYKKVLNKIHSKMHRND